MDICDCMVRQDGLGQIVCKRCNGDVYACECPLRHFSSCPEYKPENDPTFAKYVSDKLSGQLD